MAETSTVLMTVWPRIEEVPVFACNQVLTQVGGTTGEGSVPDEIFLTLGHVTPPVVMGSPEEVVAALAEVGAVPVRTLGRYSMSRQRATELIGVLGVAVQQLDAGVEQARSQGQL